MPGAATPAMGTSDALPPRTRSLTSYSVAMRRRDGGGRRRVAAGTLALLLVGAIGLAAAFEAIGPRASDDRPAAAGAIALSETSIPTPEPATPEPATPEPVTPEPATPEPVTPEPAIT